MCPNSGFGVLCVVFILSHGDMVGMCLARAQTMYCAIHNVFWNYTDSWFCPICALSCSEQIEEMLSTVMELEKMNSDEGDDDE